jgi:hypothetical protein
LYREHTESGYPRSFFTTLRWIVPLFLTVSVCLPWAGADTIILKDGGTQESDRVWESEKFVHFILKGTKTVEIRYSKDIVERIIRNGVPEEPVQGSSVNPAPATPPFGRHNQLLPPSGVTPQYEMVAAGKAPERAFPVGNKRNGFYDPHRKEKYWAAHDSRHGDLQSALKALAARYDRPIEWVIDHMGEENDLVHIHNQLSKQLETQSKNPVAGNDETAAMPTSVVTDLSPATITNLAPTEISMYPLIATEHLQGMNFYDPRRTRKYLIDTRSSYNTLNEALAGLAAHYGVSAQWIAQHIGETNDLAQVHRNIRSNLPIP